MSCRASVFIWAPFICSILFYLSLSRYAEYDFESIQTTAIPKFQAEFSHESLQGTSWRWSQRRKNILFIKIPKTGGTTLAESLGRLAFHSHLHLAKPILGSRVETCHSAEEAERQWNMMIHQNGGRIGIFASHACYKKFMKSRKYWSLYKIPMMITLMRDPFAQYISKFRFAELCCESRHWAWCEGYCPASGTKLTHTRYSEIACRNGCNEQKKYMGGGSLQQVIDSYSLVLVLERLDEGLALLLVKLGVPFRMLPYMQENTNQYVKVPNFPGEYRKEIEEKFIHVDIALYKLAVARLDWEIQSLNGTRREVFNRALSKLRIVNKKISEVCTMECHNYDALSQEKKNCNNDCLERELLNVTDSV